MPEATEINYRTRSYEFCGTRVDCYFDIDFTIIDRLCDRAKAVLITDENVFRFHKEKFEGFNVICLAAGEKTKTQTTIDGVLRRLVEFEADKNTLIVGIGGGVITDIAGFAAAIFKRGMRLALVPTTILGMVDAALGGKNGVDLGVYKNLIGSILQPEFILYDYSFLNTLPVPEWINGFAEIIKHACIRDSLLFSMLERYTLHDIHADKSLLAELIEHNVEIKMNIVTRDEFDKADRKLLNFGHSFGHAIENLHSIPHGQAVSIGIVAACNLSEKINGLSFGEAQRVVKLLAKYHLPVDIETDHSQVFEVLKLDKKRERENMHFVLLNRIGDAEAKPVSMQFIQQNMKSLI